MAAMLSADGFAPAQAATAAETYLHAAWTSEDGLPQNSASALEQTRDGYLWIGTLQGLARFDGARFTTFEAAATEGLASDRIGGLLEDRAGNLWIATESNGLSRYRDGRFTPFTTADGLPSHVIRRLFEDRAGNVWVYTSQGPVRFRERAGRSVFTYPEGLPAREEVLAICEDVNDRGTFWIATRDALSPRGDQGGKTLSPRGDQGGKTLSHVADGRRTVYTTDDWRAVGDIRMFLQGRDGTFWIRGTRGVSRLQEGRFTSYSLPGRAPSSALFEDRAATLWAIGEGTGLHRFDGSRFVPFVLPGDPIGSLTLSILEDREGSLWIGTNGNGLHRLRRRLFTAVGPEDGLPATQAHGLYEDRTGALWAATAGGGLARIEDGLLRVFTTRDGLPDNYAWAFAEDGEGVLWAGTSSGPARRVGERFEPRPEGPPKSGHTYALTLGPSGDLWMGAWEGVSRYRDGQVEYFRVVPDDYVIALLETAPLGGSRGGDTLWLGTQASGLCRFRDARSTCYSIADGLTHDTVRAIYPASVKALWLGTYGGGLCHFEDERFTCLTTAHGLPDGTIHHVLEDELGYVWLSSNKGVFRLARRELESFFQGAVARVYPDVFGKVDGMPSSECNGGFQPAGWRTGDARLWFPTAQGLTAVDPARVAASRELSAPPVHVERVSVDGDPVSPEPDVVMAPDSDRLVIEYTAPYLAVAQKMRFRYRLDEHDEHWIEAGPARRAIYTSLPAGTYRFRVQAAIGYGGWNEARTPLVITRRPHFHETAWFYVVWALPLVLIGYGGYWVRARRIRFRNQRLRALNASLNKEIAERLHAEAELAAKNVELAAKNVELERRNAEMERFTYTLSHDLKTPLVTITGYLGLLEADAMKGKADAMRRDLTFIKDATDKMALLLDELLELSRVGRLSQPPEPIPLTELAQEAAERLAGPIAARGVTVEVAPRMPVVVGERRRLLEVYLNLIDNAVRFMGDQTEPRVEIGARQEAGKVRCSVRDNGIGIDPRYHGTIFQLFHQLHPDGTGTGIGLALVKRIVETHDGNIMVESNGTGRGSTFYFTLPHAG